MSPELAEPPAKCEIKARVRNFGRAAVLLGLIGFSMGARTQEKRGVPIEDSLLSMMNQARTNANLPPLVGDKRLNDAAVMHLIEFVRNEQIADQFEGEPSLPERLRLAQAPFASAGEIVLMVPDLDHVPEQLMRNDIKQSLLNPKFSMAGFAAKQSESHLFVVVDLVRPLQALNVDEVEALITDAVQRSRTDKKLVPFNVVPMGRLRGLTCEMAKKDSLKVEPVNPYGNYIGAPSANVRNFVFTSVDPGILPAGVRTAGTTPRSIPCRSVPVSAGAPLILLEPIGFT